MVRTRDEFVFDIISNVHYNCFSCIFVECSGSVFFALNSHIDSTALLGVSHIDSTALLGVFFR